MPDQSSNPQDERQGGYGGSTGGQDPQQGGTSAAGRDSNVSSPMDGDEALGNRTGGYGGNPASTDGDTNQTGGMDRTQQSQDSNQTGQMNRESNPEQDFTRQ